jgi:hypothetical protein
MIHFPKKEKAEIGTLKRPVTHVVEVAVNKISIGEISTTLEIGRDNNMLPIAIIKTNDVIKIRPGDMGKILNLSINLF